MSSFSFPSGVSRRSQQQQQHRSYGTNTSWMTAATPDQGLHHHSHHSHHSQQQQQQQHYQYHLHERRLYQQFRRQREFVKCTEVAQFDALLNAAAEFHCEEKLHLRHLCNDTARCSGLTAVHVSAWSTTPSLLPATVHHEGSDVPDDDEEIVFTTGVDSASGSRNETVSSINSINSSSNAEEAPAPRFANLDEMLREGDLRGGGDQPGATTGSSSSGTTTNEQQLLLQRLGNRSKIVLDYSRQQVTGETMELLFDLADAVRFTERREAFRTGQKINATEQKPVLHHLLRMPRGYEFPPSSSSSSRYYNHHLHGNPQSSSSGGRYGGEALGASTSNEPSIHEVLEGIHALRDRIATFSRRIRSADHSIGLRGVTGRRITDTVVVSSGGGTHLGTQFVHRALSADQRASRAAEGRRLHFLSNVDPVDAYFATKNLDPEKTLIVVVARDLVDPTELCNFRSLRHWLVSKLRSNPKGLECEESEITQHHIVGVTTTTTSRRSSSAESNPLGIPEANLFRIDDWVIGRFSVCSAVGILPLSLHYSYEIVAEFLGGAHDMDEHFFNAPLRDNIPVLLGLLGVWNSTFMGYTTRAIVPYAEALRGLSTYVQLVDMESNGKRVAVDGTELLHPAGEINLGEPGGGMTNHPFFQLMHQGRVVPADFIGFMESPRPTDLPGEAISSHDELMCNFFGQPDSLAYGKELMDLVQEGVPDGLREHMVFSGNRPSSSLLMTRLDPFSVGQLVALYEHRTAVQGFLWGINSFDSYGVQLGCTLSAKIRHQLAASRKTGATVQGFNQSTSSLLEVYLAHNGPQQQQHGK